MIESIFWSHVDKSGPCWIWTGGRDRYGVYGRYAGRIAHRVAYEISIGPIPDGLELDHLCRMPLCVNPSHLEPVTRIENMKRRYGTYTSCSRGHEFTPENTYTYRNGRCCRTCQRETVRRYHARKRLEKVATNG